MDGLMFRSFMYPLRKTVHSSLHMLPLYVVPTQSSNLYGWHLFAILVPRLRIFKAIICRCILSE